MPNHVVTTLTVEGPELDLTRFRATHIRRVPVDDDAPDGDTTRCLDFQTVVPMPEILERIVSGSPTYDAIEAITGQRYYEVTGDTLAKQFAERLPKRDDAVTLERFLRLTPADLAMGKRALQALKETGHTDWFGWCREKWGTKWNAYAFKELVAEAERYVCRFETAWSTPTPIFATLAARYPTLTFETHSFDECWNFEAHGASELGTFTETSGEATREGYELAYGEAPDTSDEPEEEAGTHE